MENVTLKTNGTGTTTPASQLPTDPNAPIPNWPLPWIIPGFPTRQLAMNAGELHGMIYRSVLKQATDPANNDRTIAVGAIQQLLEQGLITSSEVDYLNQVTELGKIIDSYDAQQPEAAREAAQGIRKLYEKMLDEGCTPTSVTLVGLANNSAQGSVDFYLSGNTTQTGFFGSDWSGAQGGAMAGGMVGFGVGGVKGGAVGAGIGAVAGGGIQSFAWWMDNQS
ncbi:MAG: hypothetical protein AAGG75_04145 [Bacteroidota bacterium]